MPVSRTPIKSNILVSGIPRNGNCNSFTEKKIAGAQDCGEMRNAVVRDTGEMQNAGVLDTEKLVFDCSLVFSNFTPFLQPLKQQSIKK